MVVYPKHQQQSKQVEDSKQVLGQADVQPMVSDVVQSGEDVHKPSWVPGRLGKVQCEDFCDF